MMLSPSEIKEFYSIKELAELFGVSAFTIRALVRAGKIPAIRLSQRIIRIPGSYVRSLLGENLEAPQSKEKEFKEGGE